MLISLYPFDLCFYYFFMSYSSGCGLDHTWNTLNSKLVYQPLVCMDGIWISFWLLPLLQKLKRIVVILGGVMVIMFAIEPKFHWFILSWEWWIFMDNKNLWHDYSCGKVKLSAPCHKILCHIKERLRYDRGSDGQNSVAISCSVSSCFTARCVCFNQSRELWWINWEWLELRWGAQ
jgi:hypothetical protein